MVDRNEIVGIDFLVVGFALGALGYIAAQSIPIAAVGIDIAILGALVILIVPEPIPQEAYGALFKDSILNIEMMLEESGLSEKAYFIPSDEERGIRAFVQAKPQNKEEEEGDQPIASGIDSISSSNSFSSSTAVLIRGLATSPRRFVTNYGGLKGLLITPPGNQIVHLAKISKGDNLEESLREAIVDFSDLASAVRVLEEDDNGKGESDGGRFVRVEIRKPKLVVDAPKFKECLGSPLCCVASCVVAFALGKPVKLIEETQRSNVIRAVLRVLE